MSKRAPKRALIIAGPKGAGKTTFAREFLPQEAGVLAFVNARPFEQVRDTVAGSTIRPIARGLSD